jgi:hypothetical protein
MNTHKILRKFARRLHVSFFQSVPNNAPEDVDLSRLQSGQHEPGQHEPGQHGPETQLPMLFPEQTATKSNRKSTLRSQIWKA